jgi:hypothetical protein
MAERFIDRLGPLDRRAPFAAFLDAGFVALFVAIGRRNHDEEATVSGYLGTLWPFLFALLFGWIARRAWRSPTTVQTGLAIWACTVIGGMFIRRIEGDGTAPAFVIVATIFLGVTLVGWRSIWTLVESRRRTSVPA